MHSTDFIPPYDILIWGAIFNALAFESQRLFRLIDRPRITRSGMILRGLIAITGIIGMALSAGVIVTLFWHEGWEIGLGYMVFNIFIGLVVNSVSVSIAGVDSPVLGVICTIAMYPAGYILLTVLLQTYYW